MCAPLQGRMMFLMNKALFKKRVYGVAFAAVVLVMLVVCLLYTSYS